MKMSFTDVLGLIFVVLKLCGVIHWSWFFVTLPFTGPLLFYVIAYTLIAIGAEKQKQKLRDFLRK